MKIHKLYLLLLLVLGCAGMVFAGGSQEPTSGKAPVPGDVFEPVTVVDFLGRSVTIDKPVESIVFSHYSSSEAVKILDAWDMVVGSDGYTSDGIIYPGIDDLPRLTDPMAGPYTPNMELLLELSPDLFIVEIIPMPGVDELLSQLEGLVTVVTVKTYEPDDMVQSFRNLGALLDREEEAENFISWSLNTQEYLLDRTRELSDSMKTTLFYKTGWTGPDDLQTFSNEMSYVPARDRIAGCINTAADLPSQGGWVPKVDPEWLVSTDFELLLAADPQPGAYGSAATLTEGLDAYRQQIMELPVFSESTAVRNGNVYMLSSEFFGTPRHIIGFTYIAKWAHPELFRDLNPQALHQEYIDNFLRADLDLGEQGVFVYPESSQ